MPTITNRALRGSTIVALAAIGVLGLAGCTVGGDAEEEPTTGSTSEESTAPESSDAAPEGEASGATQCSDEQVSSLIGQEVPEGSLSGASATFEPASLLGDLPTTCVITLAVGDLSASYAVLPGGSATVDALVANSGGGLQNAGGALVGTVEDITVAGGAYASIAQGGSAGFENPDDLIVVIGSPSLGG